MVKKIAVCNKCGKKYPRWRLEREGVCEVVVSAKNGLKRCCGSIIESTESALVKVEGVFRRNGKRVGSGGAFSPNEINAR